MRVLSLFTGAGLGDYGLELAGMETVGQCEKDAYCRKLLSLRWPDVPKWEDIHDVTGESVRERCGAVDLVAGGFPCQPFSVAGKQRSTADDRHLWPEMLRVICEVAPTWVIAENVPGIIKLALDDVLADLEAAGYATVTLVLPAHAVGAPHRRDRVWIVGHAVSNEHRRPQPRVTGTAGSVEAAHRTPISTAGFTGGTGTDGSTVPGHAAVADPGYAQARRSQGSDSATSERAQKTAELAGCREAPSYTTDPRSEGVYRRPELSSHSFWAVEPGMGRVADGVPHRVDRLRALGNGQVVYAAKWIGDGIMKEIR